MSTTSHTFLQPSRRSHAPWKPTDIHGRSADGKAISPWPVLPPLAPADPDARHQHRTSRLRTDGPYQQDTQDMQAQTMNNGCPHTSRDPLVTREQPSHCQAHDSQGPHGMGIESFAHQDPPCTEDDRGLGNILLILTTTPHTINHAPCINDVPVCMHTDTAHVCTIANTYKHLTPQCEHTDYHVHDIHPLSAATQLTLRCPWIMQTINLPR